MTNTRLEEVKKSIKTIDHMIYVTYPILKETRLLIKILEQIHNNISAIIDLILNHEYACKRIKIYSDSKLNFETFATKCAPRYGIIQDQVNATKQIICLIKAHSASPLEFARKDKFIIMLDDLKTEEINIEKLKLYLSLVKDLAKKTELAFSLEKSFL